MEEGHVEDGWKATAATAEATQSSAARDSETHALADASKGEAKKEGKEVKGREQGSALQRLRDKQAQLKQAKEEMEALKDQLRTLNSEWGADISKLMNKLQRRQAAVLERSPQRRRPAEEDGGTSENVS